MIMILRTKINLFQFLNNSIYLTIGLAVESKRKTDHCPSEINFVLLKRIRLQIIKIEINV
jgi:hypothetical protein